MDEQKYIRPTESIQFDTFSFQCCSLNCHTDKINGSLVCTISHAAQTKSGLVLPVLFHLLHRQN